MLGAESSRSTGVDRAFFAGVPARTAAKLVGINRNSAVLFFRKLREVIVENLAREAPFSKVRSWWMRATSALGAGQAVTCLRHQ
ncbi:hypothetical protein GFL80_25530 [Rhizobium leguminosarum bv. viciae]|uniref:hypothetical protein n=1 Tax=Rhizobium leguminosarum TaxID=384 RepID=UPI001441F610|nr:hypothetical protein [Rhizobium leguminosarum]NKK87528.1 hypothetical protein [Rhizobium leguminosarum bv. viciae]